MPAANLTKSMQRLLRDRIHGILRDNLKKYGVRVVVERAVEEEKMPVIRVTYVRDQNANNIYAANAGTLTDRSVIFHLEIGAEEGMALDLAEEAWFALVKDFRADKTEPQKWGLNVSNIWWDSTVNAAQEFAFAGTVKVYRMSLEIQLQRVIMFPADMV